MRELLKCMPSKKVVQLLIHIRHGLQGEVPCVNPVTGSSRVWSTAEFKSVVEEHHLLMV